MIRGHRVMIDADLAVLYSVTMKDLPPPKKKSKSQDPSESIS